MELNFKPFPYAVTFTKSDKRDAIRYYVENIAVTERFDWYNTQDYFKFYKTNKKRFEEKLTYMLQLLTKPNRVGASWRTINGINIRKQFCLNAAIVLEYIEPTEEFMHALAYKYVSHPYCDYRFLSIFFFYDSIHKEAVYKGIVEGLTFGCKLDLFNLDKGTKNGAQILSIFKNIIGTVENPEELPLELFRILNILKKNGPIMSYERLAKSKNYISRTEEQENILEEMRFGVLSNAFDSLRKIDFDLKEDIIKGLEITKNGRMHLEQTFWAASKISKIGSRVDYLSLRKLMNDEDTKKNLNRFLLCVPTRFKTFAKAFEGDEFSLERLRNTEKYLLFSKLPLRKREKIREKSIKLLEKRLNYKYANKELPHIFEIAMSNEGLVEKYKYNRTLCEKTFSSVTLRKRYLETLRVGTEEDTTNVQNISNHFFVKVWDGCVSIWHMIKKEGEKKLSQSRQLLMTLVKDSDLVLEVINRDKEGQIKRYSATTLEKAGRHRKTFQTVNNHRAFLFLFAFIKALRENKDILEKMREFDLVFKKIVC